MRPSGQFARSVAAPSGPNELGLVNAQSGSWLFGARLTGNAILFDVTLVNEWSAIRKLGSFPIMAVKRRYRTELIHATSRPRHLQTAADELRYFGKTTQPEPPTLFGSQSDFPRRFADVPLPSSRSSELYLSFLQTLAASHRKTLGPACYLEPERDPQLPAGQLSPWCFALRWVVVGPCARLRADIRVRKELKECSK